LGEALGGASVVEPVRALLAWLRPRPLPPLPFEALAPYLARDKKARAEGLYWVVPMGLGELAIRPVPAKILEETYRRFREAR
jgi:3-dehydroquinate synthase